MARTEREKACSHIATEPEGKVTISSYFQVPSAVAPGRALTFLPAAAICLDMREGFVNRLAIAVLLLAAGVFAPIGSASAHQGHASAPTVHSPTIHSPTVQEASASDAALVGNDALAPVSDHAQGGGAPCSEDSGPGHMSGCCTVACHAALAAAALTVGPCCEPIAHADAWPAEVLAGLSGHRTERPPKQA